MSKSVNSVTLIGNITNELELKTANNGVTYVKFGLATNESYVKDGERIDKAEYHNIIAWNKTAEIIAKHLSKGSKIYVLGKLQTHQYEKNNDKHFMTEIIAREVIFLGGKNPKQIANETEVPF